MKSAKTTTHGGPGCYRVLSVVSGYEGRTFSDNRDAITYADSLESWQREPLPNAPLRARDTLLAHLARATDPRNGRGLYVRPGLESSCISVRESLDRLRGELQGRRAAARAIRQTERKLSIKESPRHVGKLLGVEIEYYPGMCSYDCRSRLEDIVGDGSLGDAGREIRRLTWQGEDGRLWGLKTMRIQGKVGKDFGLHVHVDARHLDKEAAEAGYDRLCRVFTKWFKKLCPKSRQNNPYCQWKNNRSGSLDYHSPSRGERYAAFNWCSYSEHGSIEFRMQGNFNPKRGRERADLLNVGAIENWALICQEAFAWACNPSRPDPRTFGEFACGFPEPLASWIRLRKESLWGSLEDVRMDERTESALG